MWWYARFRRWLDSTPKEPQGGITVGAFPFATNCEAAQFSFEWPAAAPLAEDEVAVPCHGDDLVRLVWQLDCSMFTLIASESANVILVSHRFNRLFAHRFGFRLLLLEKATLVIKALAV